MKAQADVAAQQFGRDSAAYLNYKGFAFPGAHWLFVCPSVLRAASEDIQPKKQGSRLGIGFELRIVLVLGERNELLREVPGSRRCDTRGDSSMTSVAMDV